MAKPMAKVSGPLVLLLRPPCQQSALVLLLALLLLCVRPGCGGPDDQASRDYIHYATTKHLEKHGPKYLDREAVHIPRLAALDVSPADGSCTRRVALLTMANSMLMEKLLPILLSSLARIPHTTPQGKTSTLNKHTIVACPLAAHSYCQHLAARYRHHCLLDRWSGLSDEVLDPGTPQQRGFSYAKLKYLVNVLSYDVDVLYLDLDTWVASDPLVHVLGSEADMAVSVDGCVATGSDGSGGDGLTGGKSSSSSGIISAGDEAGGGPHGIGVPLHTGVSYFRSSAGVTRCVYSWLVDMWWQPHARNSSWEGDAFARVVPECADAFGLSLVALPPDRFTTLCAGQCGCSIADGRQAAGTAGTVVPAPAQDGSECPSAVRDRWSVLHFSCMTSAKDRVSALMRLHQLYGRGD